MEFHTVIEQVVKQCHDRGHEVSPSFASFIVKSCSDPTAGTSTPKTAHSLGHLIAIAVEKASAVDSPPIETAKLQVAFSEAAAAAEATIASTKEKRRTEKSRFSTAIVEHRSLNPSALESLFANIVGYAAVKGAGPGDEGPESRDVRKEVASLIERVFPPRALPDFVVGQPGDKLVHIRELTEIVTGMRLMVGSLTIAPPAPEKLLEETIELQRALELSAERLAATVASYTAVVTVSLDNPANPKCQPKVGALRLIQELTHRWQVLILVRGLLDDVREIRPRINELSELYKQHVADLQAATSAEGDAPAAAGSSLLRPELYPACMMLTRIRKQLVAERVIVQGRLAMWTAMQRHLLLPQTAPESARTAPAFELSIRQDEIDAALAVIAAKQSQDPVQLQRRPRCKDVQVVSPEDFARMTGEAPPATATRTPTRGLISLPGPEAIAFHGFCPWTLVERAGMVVEGSKSIGVVAYKNKLYRFASNKALQAFADDPERYISEVFKLAAAQTEYVLLLDLSDSFHGLCGQQAVSFGKDGKKRAPARQADASAQTADHPVEQHVQKDYHWNEWELRRRAIQLVDLQNKRTKSTQTDDSHFRRENVTQYWQPKSVGTQTGVDEATNTAAKKTYLAGLRGGDERNPRTVAVTWDLTEGQRKNMVQANQRK